MKGTIAIHKQLGVFIGAYKNYTFFAKDDVFATYKAFSFIDVEDANLYFTENLEKTTDLKVKDMIFVNVEYKSNFPSVVDIVKAGYGQYTFNMLNHMPLQNNYIN